MRVTPKFSSSEQHQEPWPAWPVHSNAELKALERVLSSRLWWRNEGEEVSTFERSFADYQGGGYPLAVSNGTQALEIALAALGIGEGDEVILPALTFYSTASAVLMNRATPVFADVDASTGCLTADEVERRLTDRTKAIIAVHLGGQMCDMPSLRRIADRTGCKLIEDAAHAIGAEWVGKRSGSWSDAAAFSFQAAKLITAGEGGLILFKSPAVHLHAVKLSNCGRMPGDTGYGHDVLGTNARMTEFTAAVLSAQLGRLDMQFQQREAAFQLLTGMLADTPDILFMAERPEITRHARYSVFFTLNSICNGAINRDTVLARLRAQGVPAAPAYPPVYATPVFRDRLFGARYRETCPQSTPQHWGPCQNAEAIGAQMIALPHRVLLAPRHRIADLSKVIRTIDRD